MRRAKFWKTLAYLAPALVAASLVYINALSGEFVYDDNEQIVKNPWVHELRYFPKTITRPVWAYQTPEPTNYYRPVQMGLYNLLWAAFGGASVPFHAASLLFHLLCTATLFLLAGYLSRDLATAGGAALLFAVHPLNTEAVAWIACLPELSYAFFVLAALLLHAQSRTGSPGRRKILLALAVAMALLGMFSKETALTLLPLILLFEIWFRPPGESSPDGPTAPARPPAGRGKSRSSLRTAAARCARALLPYALASLAYLLVRVGVVGGFAPRSRPDLTAMDAVLNAPVLLVSYLGAMMVPVRLLAFHVLDRVPSALHPLFLGSVSGIAVLAFLLVRLSRRRPDLAMAGALALLPLMPVLYIPALGENAFAERYAYLPTAGFAWFVAGSLAAMAGAIGGTRGRAAGIAALAILAVPCALRTVARNADWHDDRRLATATLKEEPRAWHMHVVLASWYYRHERLEESLHALEEGLAAFPGNPRLQIGVTSSQLQLHRIRPEEAIQDFLAVSAAYPTFYDAQYGLGDAYLKIHRSSDAEAAFRRAIAINPLSIEAHEGLFVALVAQGRPVDWNEVRKRLSNPPALRQMDKLLEGVAQEKAGRLDEAEASLLEALRLDPKSDRALLSLAVVEDRRGSFQAAVEYCRKCIALKPDSVEAYQQLGVSALKLGEVREAIEALEKAVAIDPADKEAHDRLGVAYAKAGRTADARAAFEKALELDPAFEKARFNLNRLEHGIESGARK